MDPTTTLGRMLIKTSAAAHRIVYRITGGRVGHRFGRNASTLLLDHVGAKSGTPRTSPLFYLEDGDDLVLVASYHGAPHHPAWFHNLMAQPQTAVRVGSEVREVVARVATADELDRLWPRAVNAYKPYEEFRRDAAKAGRVVPMVILERR
jgi:deazaflavin-dependent oxidoreductase (nitroreductase family)